MTITIDILGTTSLHFKVEPVYALAAIRKVILPKLEPDAYIDNEGVVFENQRSGWYDYEHRATAKRATPEELELYKAYAVINKHLRGL